MQRLVYNEAFFNSEPEELGWISAAIAAGASILPSLFGGRQSAQYQGLAGINQAGQQAIGSLQQLLQLVTSGQIPAAQAASEASRIAGILNDPAVVYQARRGQDAAALQNFKQQAATLVEQIQFASASRSAADPGVPTMGYTQPSGFDPKTVMLIGGGLLALMLLRN